MPSKTPRGFEVSLESSLMKYIEYIAVDAWLSNQILLQVWWLAEIQSSFSTTQQMKQCFNIQYLLM